MRRFILDYFSNNKKNIITLLIVLFIGIILGAIYIQYSSDKQVIINETNILIENFRNSKDINRLNLLITSIKNNILFILIIWFLGCTVIGGILIYLNILYKGFSIGYAFWSILLCLGIKKGVWVGIISLVIHNLIYIPALFLVSNNGIKLYKSIYKRSLNLKEELIKHFVIMLITIMLSLISCFIEVYFCTNILIFLKEIV